MKTQHLIFSIFFLAIFFSCQTPSAEKIELSILVDKTGSHLSNQAEIKAENFLQIFDLKHNPFNHGTVRVAVLDDTHLAKSQQTKLSSISSIADYQKYVREAEIQRFTKQVDTLIQNIQNAPNGKTASSLFIPIHRELNRLAKTTATQKHLCIYSDLFENSHTLFSVYDKQKFAKLIKQPKKLNEIISQKAPLPQNLAGINVYLIYKLFT